MDIKHSGIMQFLTRDKQPIRNTNIEHKEQLSALDRMAIKITDKVGSMGFFLIILTWTVVWFAWNTLMPSSWAFDPFPAFALWLFISNVIQIFLMPLIMVGQNLQSKHAEARAEADFEINTKAELEIETVLIHLEKQNELILKILEQQQKERGKQ